jgi:hypothetical protein
VNLQWECLDVGWRCFFQGACLYLGIEELVYYQREGNIHSNVRDRVKARFIRMSEIEEL